MAADVLLVLSEFADKLLKEGAFNGTKIVLLVQLQCALTCVRQLALMAVIAATLASGKKSREEAMAEQENRSQYYTAIGWLCEYVSCTAQT